MKKALIARELERIAQDETVHAIFVEFVKEYYLGEFRPNCVIGDIAQRTNELLRRKIAEATIEEQTFNLFSRYSWKEFFSVNAETDVIFEAIRHKFQSAYAQLNLRYVESKRMVTYGDFIDARIFKSAPLDESDSDDPVIVPDLVSGQKMYYFLKESYKKMFMEMPDIEIVLFISGVPNVTTGAMGYSAQEIASRILP